MTLAQEPKQFFEIWKASGRHLEGIWESSESHLGGILESSGNHLGGIWGASGRHLGHLGAIWAKICSGSENVPKPLCFTVENGMTDHFAAEWRR